MSIQELWNAYSRIHHGKIAMDFGDNFTPFAILTTLPGEGRSI
jgi:hypothetical protein